MKVRYTGIEFIFGIDEAKIIHKALDEYTDRRMEEERDYWNNLALDLESKIRLELEKISENKKAL